MYRKYYCGTKDQQFRQKAVRGHGSSCAPPIEQRVAVRVNLESLSLLLAGLALTVNLVILIVIGRVLLDTGRTRKAGDERLEILREQQERLRYMNTERSVLKEELERLRQVIDERENGRQLALPAPDELGEQHKYPWWRRMLRSRL